MATPFDEASVDLCRTFDLPIIKIASSDSRNLAILEKIATLENQLLFPLEGLSTNDR